jgi:hypothetical protein
MKFVIVYFKNVNVGLEWILGPVHAIGIARQSRLVQLHESGDLALAVMVIVTMWQADSGKVAKAFWDSPLLESENGYSEISNLMDEADAQSCMDDFRSYDA